MNGKKERLVYYGGFIISVVTALIYIFTNVSYDSEYQIAMGYRLIQGDRMLVNMWEPHQTSAFLTAGLEWLYISITGMTTGIVLYLQIVSTIIRGLIAVALYKCFEDDCGKKVSFIIAFLFFTILPKDIAIAEFANMQLWFGTLMVICLVKFFKVKRTIWILPAALCMCLQVISYPSCIIVAVPAVILLYVYGGKKKKTVLIFLLVCALAGICYAGYFICSLGIETILKTLELALSVEPTHTVSAGTKIVNYLIGIGKLLLPLVISIAAGLIVTLIIKTTKKEKSFSKDTCIKLTGLVLLAYYLYIIFSVENRHAGSVLYVFLIALGIMNIKCLSCNKKMIYVVAVTISLSSFLATLILADGPIETSVPYALLAICVSIIPISVRLEKDSDKSRIGYLGLLIAFIALFFVRTIYIRIPLSGRGQIMSVTEDMSIIRIGPAAGIITDTEGACKQRDSFREWGNYISEGDNILIIGGDVVDTLGYLYMDTKVSTPSVMSTPTYNDSLLDYWEKNPDKYPDVVIVSSYMGEIDWSVRANKWVWNWLGNQYESKEIKKGTWWTYYYR